MRAVLASLACLLSFGVLVLVGGCTSGPKAFLPVDSPLQAWQKPELDETTAAQPPPPEAKPDAKMEKKPAKGGTGK
jgi:hypothetical protein